MQPQNSQSTNRQAAEQGRSNVRQFPVPEPVISNPFDQVNKFDLAQWNQIVTDISKPEVAKAVILVMDQRDSLKSLFPSIYVRAHQTCLKIERKKERRAEQIAMVKKVLTNMIALTRTAVLRIRIGVHQLTHRGQQRLF